MSEGHSTDHDQQDLVSQLIAMVTAMLEDAIEAAVEGQSPALSQSQLARRVHELQRNLRDVVVIVEAESIIAKLNANHTTDRNT